MKKLTREDGASPDIANENIERLRELFPGVFTGGRVDLDALRETLGEFVDDREERYGLSWHGKSRARQTAQRPSMATLRPCPKESVNWDSTKNIFIEGDNLEVLKLLQKSYHRKVKVIYIDPPYNTGKEFIYPDKFKDNLGTYLRYTGQVNDDGLKLSANSETSGRFHTNWLNMMYPRVKLARNLLRDNGVIFISIDDHEVGNLRLLLDEVFGPENFIATIIWHKKYARQNDATWFSTAHDYLLVYARSASEWRPNLLPRSEEQNKGYKNPDDDPRGRWQSVVYTCNKTAEERPNLYYAIKHPRTGTSIWPKRDRVWAFSEERHRQNEANGRVWWGLNQERDFPRQKVYLSDVNKGVVPDTLWRRQDAGDNQDAQRTLSKLLGDDAAFSSPKPVKLVRRILDIATSPASGDIVMDFFAGSGTTGHAVMEQNVEDCGNRRYVLVQLPVPVDRTRFTHISELTRARLTAVGDKYRGTITTSDCGFRSFKLSNSNIKPWDANFDSIGQDLIEAIDNIKSDRSEEDILYELLLKYGLDLAIPIESRTIAGFPVAIIGAGALVVCLALGITLDVVRGIASLKRELNPEIMRVVFRDSGFPSDVVKTNAKQILHQAGVTDVRSL